MLLLLLLLLPLFLLLCMCCVHAVSKRGPLASAYVKRGFPQLIPLCSNIFALVTRTFRPSLMARPGVARTIGLEVAARAWCFLTSAPGG